MPSFLAPAYFHFQLREPQQNETQTQMFQHKNKNYANQKQL